MNNTKLKAYLATFMVISFIAIIYSLMRVEVPSVNNDVVMVLIGALSGIVKDLFAYYFGSSEGSARKTELLGAKPEVPQ